MVYSTENNSYSICPRVFPVIHNNNNNDNHRDSRYSTQEFSAHTLRSVYRAVVLIVLIVLVRRHATPSGMPAFNFAITISIQHAKIHGNLFHSAASHHPHRMSYSLAGIRPIKYTTQATCTHHHQHHHHQHHHMCTRIVYLFSYIFIIIDLTECRKWNYSGRQRRKCFTIFPIFWLRIETVENVCVFAGRMRRTINVMSVALLIGTQQTHLFADEKPSGFMY